VQIGNIVVAGQDVLGHRYDEEHIQHAKGYAAKLVWIILPELKSLVLGVAGGDVQGFNALVVTSMHILRS
jgi:hypothetical protein